MRWLFVLLLLANAVFFVWQNRLVSENKIAEVVPEGIARVRLLTEIDASLLLPRASDNTPVTDNPVIDKPVAPITNAPVADKPVTNAPITNAPVIDKPVTDKPVTDKPVTDKPVTDKPVTDKPVTDKSVIDKPVTDNPVTDNPVTDNPVTDKSVIDKPVTDNPVTDKSVIDKSVIDKSVTDKPVIDQWCQVISGLDSEDEAQRLLEGLEKAGLSAEIKVFDTEAVLAFELVMDKPVAADENALLMDSFSALDIQPEETEFNGVAVYVLGRFGSRNEIDEVLFGLEEVGAPRIYQLVSKDSYFEVWVQSDDGAETSNKINLLASIYSPEIKIEKKVCKGVASAGERD